LAIAHRAALVIAPKPVRDRLAVHGHFLDAEGLDAEAIRTAWSRAAPGRPDQAYHLAIAAELYGRSVIAEEAAESAEGPSIYVREQLRRRVRSSDDVGALRLACAEHGNADDVLAASLLSDPPSTRRSSGARAAQGSELLRQIVHTRSLHSIADLERSEMVGRLDELSVFARSGVILRVLEVVTGGGDVAELSPAVRRVLHHADTSALIRPDQVMAFAACADLGDSWFAAIAQTAGELTARASRVVLAFRAAEHGRPVDDVILGSTLELIADRSVHPALWTSGLDYWRRLTGECWDGVRGFDMAPAAPRPQAPVGDLAEVDAAGRASLAAGNLAAALASFETVRWLCEQADDDRRTTEMAARLNAGWCVAHLDPDAWMPYVESVLAEVGPPAELHRLAAAASGLLLRARGVGVLAGHLDDCARTVGSARTKGVLDADDVAELNALIESIDATAEHPSLWASGLSSWSLITGTSWSPERSDRGVEAPVPAPLLGPRRVLSVEEISRLDGRARRALAKGRHRTAIELFGRVRAASFAADPPLVTTEYAARLNEGFSRWKAGQARDRWAPLIESILETVGPPLLAAIIRARAAEILDRRCP
jgi:hypothetical protein